MIEIARSNRRSGAFKILKPFLIYSLLIILLGSCSSYPKKSDINDLAVKAAFKVAQPTLEKILLTESPVLPASWSRFPIVNQLPGKGAFNPHSYQKKSISYDDDGNLLLLPGDYSIPVMTYCMKMGGASPNGHTYSLALLQGARAKIIRDLNIKASYQFSPTDVQILSWSLQAGLSYEELTDKSQEIIDSVMPERKSEIKESFLKHFEKKWDDLAENSKGFIPDFEQASDQLLNEMGETGKTISEIRNFRKLVREHGNNYSRLSQLIEIKSQSAKESKKTDWSKISDRVYARFATKGHYQEVGQIEIRVLNSKGPSQKVAVDISSWIADPINLLIQPLSFSAMAGSRGVLLVPALAETPFAAALILSAVLAAEVIDWDAFDRLTKFLSTATDSRIQSLIQQGNLALSKEHDELERPARELEVIDKETKLMASKKDKNTREYEKEGGEKDLQNDFDKFPGEIKKAQDGTEMKVLPDGKTVVKRPATKTDKRNILEMQPPQGSIKEINRIRVKLRYYEK